MSFMQWYHILIIVFICLIPCFFALLLYCFNRVFYSKSRKPLKEDEFDLPTEGEYDKFKKQMIAWAKNSRTYPHQNFEITSFDGLTLRGKYYEKEKGKPIEIMFNGYRGSAERDMSGGIERCFALGRNCLVVNQRSSGLSDGHVITFGVKERKDCRKWIDFVIEKFGKDVEIILTGISMGGATVIMTAQDKLPKNVKYVLADCPFTSAKEMISLTVKRMGLPPRLLYPIIKLSARIFGKFNLEETYPLKAVKTASVPIIFYHGKADGFIPYEMSQRLYENCVSEKKLVLIDGADHGLCYPEAKQHYIDELKEFNSRFTN